MSRARATSPPVQPKEEGAVNGAGRTQQPRNEVWSVPGSRPGPLRWLGHSQTASGSSPRPVASRPTRLCALVPSSDCDPTRQHLRYERQVCLLWHHQRDRGVPRRAPSQSSALTTRRAASPSRATAAPRPGRFRPRHGGLNNLVNTVAHRTTSWSSSTTVPRRVECTCSPFRSATSVRPGARRRT